MHTRRFDPRGKAWTSGLSRRRALGRLAGGGAAAALAAVGLRRVPVAAQDATPIAAPAGWRTEHLEVDFTPQDPVTIARAGGGPPQRGDFFHISGPIYARDDVGGTQIGTYQCFGAWTHPAEATDAPDQRLTTVWFHMDDGAIAGLINEGGANHDELVGAVQGGTGRYTGALGTFRQPILPAAAPATPEAVPGVAATPAAAQLVVRGVFDLLLPETS